jgi:hypothetical protein
MYKADYSLNSSMSEYISMLLNLEYSLQCDAYVGTLASNWCRIVDEMRATVGNDKIAFPNSLIFTEFDLNVR